MYCFTKTKKNNKEHYYFWLRCQITATCIHKQIHPSTFQHSKRHPPCAQKDTRTNTWVRWGLGQWGRIPWWMEIPAFITILTKYIKQFLETCRNTEIWCLDAGFSLIFLKSPQQRWNDLQEQHSFCFFQHYWKNIRMKLINICLKHFQAVVVRIAIVLIKKISKVILYHG